MIKNIFNPGHYSKNVNIALLVLRMAAGIFMLTHGIGKLVMLFSGDPIQFADPIGLGQGPSLFLTVFAEVFCSVLLIFGVATRFAALPLLINMLVAVLVIHSTDAFKVKELAMFYMAVYITIALAGAGKYSIDNFAYRYIYRNA